MDSIMMKGHENCFKTDKKYMDGLFYGHCTPLTTDVLLTKVLSFFFMNISQINCQDDQLLIILTGHGQ